MYSRVSSFQINPSHVAVVEARMSDIRASVSAIPGIVSVYTAWRADGHAVTMSVYQDQAAADAAAPQIKEIWSGLADLLTGPPQVEAFDNAARLSE